MTPNNLRSLVAQVTRGRRSVVSGRNFSTRSRRNLSTRSRRDFSSSGIRDESGGSYINLFGSSMMFGFCVVSTSETI